MYMAWNEAKREDLLASTEGSTLVHHGLPPFPLPNRAWHGLLVIYYSFLSACGHTGSMNNAPLINIDNIECLCVGVHAHVCVCVCVCV